MYVCSSRWNWSGPTVESRRLSGSDFQTVGPADAKARRPITRRTRGTFSCWRLLDQSYRKTAEIATFSRQRRHGKLTATDRPVVPYCFGYFAVYSTLLNRTSLAVCSASALCSRRKKIVNVTASQRSCRAILMRWN